MSSTNIIYLDLNPHENRNQLYRRITEIRHYKVQGTKYSSYKRDPKDSVEEHCNKLVKFCNDNFCPPPVQCKKMKCIKGIGGDTYVRDSDDSSSDDEGDDKESVIQQVPIDREKHIIQQRQLRAAKRMVPIVKFK